MKKNTAIRAFSLVELLVIVAIIGIISIVALPAYSNYVTRTKLTEALATLDNYKKDVQDYFLSHGVSTEEQLQSFDVTDYTDIGDENASVMSDIIGHNGRIVGVSTIMGKTYQIALTPRIEDNLFKWSCTVSIVEQNSTIEDSYNGQVYYGFWNGDNGSYEAPNSSSIPNGCNTSSENLNSDFEEYRSQRQTQDQQLVDAHNTALNAWRDRTDNTAAQDQTYTDARDSMLEAEASALNAFSDYQKYQSIESNQSNLDYYQGLIDNAADGVDTTSWQSSIDYYQGRIDNIQATMSNQAGSAYTDSNSAAEFFDQQRDAYNASRTQANERYAEIQAEQRNQTSTYNDTESQGFDTDYNNAYTQYNENMDAIDPEFDHSVETSRNETFNGEDFTTGQFSSFGNRFSTWPYSSI